MIFLLTQVKIEVLVKYMTQLLIVIGSESDKKFINEGLEYLGKSNINYEVMVSSTHREPLKTSESILKALENSNIKVIISGAATATGLPGIVAGYLKDTRIAIFGVRFIKEPGPGIIEDASFNLSSMPSGVPLAYTGYNEKGFLHACMLAKRAVEQT